MAAPSDDGPEKGFGYGSLFKPDPAVHLARLPCHELGIADRRPFVDLSACFEQSRSVERKARGNPNLL
jgi:hypothetical protein